MKNNWILVFLNQTIRLCQAVKLILVKITSVSMDSVNQGRRGEVIGVNVREDTQGNTVTTCRHVSKKFFEADILIQLQNVHPGPGLNSDDVKDRVERTAVNPGKLKRGKSDFIAKMDIHTFIISQSFENVVARNASKLNSCA